MMDEIDTNKFYETAPYYVYIHSRPDGTPFYVGKGVKKRAYSMSPSRRTKHYMNVVNKYGRENIIVKLIPCASEYIAHTLEKIHISLLREAGERLVNITDGGEGASGHKSNEKQLNALRQWHGAYHKLPEESKKRIIAGLARGTAKRGEWWKTEEGKQHLKRIAELNATRPREEREAVCSGCGIKYTTKSSKSKYCNDGCGQRYRRKQEQEELIKSGYIKPKYSHSEEVREKMSAAKKGKKLSPDHRQKLSEGHRRRIEKARNG